MAEKNENWIGFRWALIAVLLLAVWAASLTVPRPTVVFHGGPRWIGENMLVGIPVLCALVLFTGFMVHRWRTRHQRKLARLIADRLRDEEKETRTQQELEHKKRVDELKRQLAEAERQAAQSKRDARSQATERRKEAAERWKRELHEEIRREQQLKDERLSSKPLA